MTENQISKYSEYKLLHVTEGGCGTILLGSSGLPIKKIEDVLNKSAAEGWQMIFMVIELQELCTRFNTGRLAQEEYSNEINKILSRNREYIKRTEERFKIKKDDLFREMEESILK